MAILTRLSRFARRDLQCIREGISLRTTRHYASFLTVGKLEEPKASGEVYPTGQCFVHRLFGFRGVVLTSWRTKLHDHTIQEGKSGVSALQPLVSDRICYVALLDTVDLQGMAEMWQDAAYFLAEDANQLHVGMRRINGLAYIEHSEMLPYGTLDPAPIRHQLFSHFLTASRNAQAGSTPSSGTAGGVKAVSNSGKSTPNAQANMIEFHPTSMLKQFLDDSASWLEPGTTVSDISENVRVSVTPFYLGELGRSKQYCWSYSVRMENLNPDEPVRLLRRFWRVFSISGTANTWKGDGVVGRRPELYNGRPFFQYSSTVALYTAGGHMWGTYHFERTNGEEFEVRIPTFYLETGDQRNRKPDSAVTSHADSSASASGEDTRVDSMKTRKRKDGEANAKEDKTTTDKTGKSQRTSGAKNGANSGPKSPSRAPTQPETTGPSGDGRPNDPPSPADK